MKKIKIICTLGPSSYKKEILNLLKREKIDIFRINLSHTNKKDIKKKILFLKKNKIKGICIDTEGAQIRTTDTKKKILLKSGKTITISNRDKYSDLNNINFYPEFNLLSISKKTKIYIGFNNLMLEVISKNIEENSLICKVIISGYLESKKGVHINKNIKLSPFTEKDLYAMELATKLKVKNFAISFVNNHKEIKHLKNILGKKVNIISKIETLNALKDLKNISNFSDSMLIDRGDLSRYIPIEEIPKIQENIIKFGKSVGTPVYVATNLLETMIKDYSPTRAESHDIYSTLKQGASGLVLAAETAIGIDPINCVKFLKKCINSFKKKKIIKFT